MNTMMQQIPAFSAPMGATGAFDGLTALMGVVRHSEGRLPEVSRRQRRQARRRRLM